MADKNALTKNEKLALVIAAAIGAVSGFIVGYIVYAVAQGADGAFSFKWWLRQPLDRGGIWWALLGGSMAAAIVYLRRLLARPH